MCEVPAPCEPLPVGSTCFANGLYFAETSFASTGLTYDETNQQLLLLSTLQTVPQCWLSIQAFLCAIFLPRCVNSTIVLPTQAQCNNALQECSLFLQSDLAIVNSSLLNRAFNCKWLPVSCGSSPQAASSNWLVSSMNVTNGFCASPLTATQYDANSISSVSSCAPLCPVGDFRQFSSVEIATYDTLITVIGSITLAVLLFATIFMIAHRVVRKSSSMDRYILNMHITICCALYAVATAISLIPVARNGALRTSLACRSDDASLRLDEPDFGADSLAPACVIQFAVSYFVLIAAIAHTLATADLLASFLIRRLDHFASTTHSTGNSCFGKRSIRIRHRVHRFAPWLFSAVLTLLAMFLSLVDGSSVTGLCFVSMRNVAARVCLVLAPVGVMSIVTCIQLFRSVHHLRKLTSTGGNELRFFATHLGLLSGGIFLCALLCGATHIADWVSLSGAEVPFLASLVCNWIAAAREALSSTSRPSSSPTLLTQAELGVPLPLGSNVCGMALSSTAPAAICMCSMYAAGCLFAVVFIVGHRDFWRFFALLLSDALRVRLLIGNKSKNPKAQSAPGKPSRADLISVAYLHARNTHLTPESLQQFAEAEIYRERARAEAEAIMRHNRLARHACSLIDSMFGKLHKLTRLATNSNSTGDQFDGNDVHESGSDLEEEEDAEVDESDEQFVRTLLPTLLVRRGAIACPAEMGAETDANGNGVMEVDCDCDCTPQRNDDCDYESALLPNQKLRRRRSRSLTSVFSKISNAMRRGHSDSFVSSVTATASEYRVRGGYPVHSNSDSKTHSVESLSVRTKHRRGSSLSSYSRSVAPRDPLPSTAAWQGGRGRGHAVPSCRCHLAAAHVMPTYAYVNNAFQRHSTVENESENENETVVDEHEIDAEYATVNYSYGTAAPLDRDGNMRQSALSKMSKMSGWSADVSITSLSSSVRYRMLRLVAAASTANPLTALRAAANDSHRETIPPNASSPHAECQF